MLRQVKAQISQAMQRAALGGLGGLMAMVGLGFLTAALYMYLLTQTDPITACLIIGGGFFGVGLVLVGLSRPASDPAPKPAQSTDVPTSAMTPVVVAFLDGLQQGMAARKAGNHVAR